MKKNILIFVLISIGTVCTYSQNDLYPKIPAWKVLNLDNWTGIKKNGDVGTLYIPGTIIYKVPEGTRGWYQRGLMGEHDGVMDARHWFGIRFNILLESDELFEAKLTVSIPKQGRHNLLDSSSATIKVQGKGWNTLTVPFHTFDYSRGQSYFLKFIKQISITGKYAKSVPNAQVSLRDIRFVKGNPLYIDAVIRSKPGDADSTVRYTATIGNSSDAVQLVTLKFRDKGWEGMKARVEPAFAALQPGEEKNINVYVTVPATAPQGSQETHTLVASSATCNATEIDFITVRRLASPYLLLTEPEWQEVLNKTKKYEWAKKEMDEFIRKADEFEVPETPAGNIKGEGSPAVFKSYLEQKFWPVAVAYKLTGNLKYAEKIALLLRRLSAPGAYPTTLHANSQDIPQEGGFWEGIARSYDLIRDAGVLTTEDKKLIEHSLRLYIYTIEDGFGNGGISNWSVFNLCPAAQCALALQDMYHFNRLMNEPCGIKDHIRYGTMDDGWWYEVSLSYNIGCVENMTALGLAAHPFGIDFLHEKISVSLTQNVGLRPFEYEKFLGMAFGKFGPVTRNYVSVKDMWDAITVYPDYRGIMFGMGDGHEQKVGSGPFELAYFAFRDSNYAAVLKQADSRDLIYGIPELPAQTPKLYTLSAHADNAGVAVLRSQTEGREQREQIQAALKYGTHGSYHGHFDRASLLSLMRYGRSFWNPEASWFGYGSYMYKWWVQPSMAHNMVVVDGKMQEPQETSPLLFYSGKMLQAMAVETNARWSNPPYFGGYDHIDRVRAGTAGYVEIPDNRPKITEVTDYTEPVLQRRLMVVTDDYVLLADYLKALKEHTFDNLFHLRGARASETLKFNGHDAQFDFSPLSSGQFITCVDKFIATNGAQIYSRMVANSEHGWDTGGFNGYQEPGLLYIDVYHVWPQKGEVRIGNYAEGRNISKKLVYQVVADDKILTADSLGTWILGNKAIDLNVKGTKTLQLRVKTGRGAGTKNTLFWANARIVTSKGQEILLSQLKPLITNVISTPQHGKDYEGGPVKIAGTEYTDILATEPENPKEYAVLSFDLAGLDAKNFKANIGGDYPVGDEEQVRKTTSYRTSGKEVRFLSVIEPYEDKKMVSKVTAISADALLIELTDGRIQHITIENFGEINANIRVKITEKKDGKEIRFETTK
jgi:hypothetical protein